MPEPIQRSARYMPALDGVRALAVCAVIAYHLGLGWAPGGLLGVGVFFTLSGYLITDLLLGQWDGGRRRLADFWARRARRLLPALYLMLIVVSVWVAVGFHSRLGEVRGQVISALLYVNNWWQISQHVSYFQQFGPPSPLGHLWSLAVEEQFYVVWPWLLLIGVWLVRERRRPIKARPRLAGVTLALAAASAIEMAVLYHPSLDPSRIYDGSDTRAFGLLMGAALAMVWPSRALTGRVTPGARRIIDCLGSLGLAAIVVLVWRTNQYSPFLYHGGLVLLSVATVLVVAAGAHPASRLARALGAGPLRWVGVRSYGIYLWHQPIIVLTTPAGSHSVAPLRAGAQVAASVLMAALSWRYLEQPIRHGALGRMWAALQASRSDRRRFPVRVGAAGAVGGVGGLGVAATLAVALAAGLAVALAGLALAGVRLPRLTGSPRLAAAVRRADLASPPHDAVTTVRTTPSTKVAARSVARARRRVAPPPAPKRPSAPRTACRAVVHIGDSTSLGLTSSDYLPDPGQRITAQYARVGVTEQHMEITAATSIVETLPGRTNAQAVARSLIASGYHGCWVLALGTNDTADVYVGSSVSLATRIQRMMSTIGAQPVMWVNVKSLVSNGPYAEANMQHWDQALLKACGRYPNMRVYDWASVAQDRWFIPDGIHYYSPGYAARAHLIADALATAFPAAGGGAAPGCVVHTPSLSIRVRGVSG